MHKSICDEYTQIPAMMSYTVVPLVLGYAQSYLQADSNPVTNSTILMVTACGGMLAACAEEIRLKNKAREEKWGTTKSSKIIQRGQLRAYGLCLTGGILTSVFVAATDISKTDHEIDSEFSVIEQSEQNILYYEPQ